MSCRFYAFEQDVMEWEDIKQIVPEEAAVFEQQLQAAGTDIDEFCRAMKYEDYLDADVADAEIAEWHDRLMEAWDRLDEAFWAATAVEGAGLELTPEYHDPDFEDAVAFFAVEGVHQLTPAGAKYEEMIERRQFTGVG